MKKTRIALPIPSIAALSALTLLATLSVSANAAEISFVNESFDNAAKVVSTSVNVLKYDGWFGHSGTATNYTVDTTAGTLTVGNVHALTYFNNVATLATVGDSLTATFHIVFNAPVDGSNGIRVALFNSGGVANRVTNSGHGNGNNLFYPYTGYLANTIFKGDGSQKAVQLLHRDAMNLSYGNNSFMHSIGTVGASNRYKKVGATDSGGTSATPVNGGTYTGTFTITRVAEGTKVSFSLVGEGLASFAYESIDATAQNPFTTFDTFGIFLNSAATSLTLQDVTVVGNIAAAIPEPKTSALTLAALGVLAAIGAKAFRAKQDRE
ncbi:hypothetical protein [Geminisphaera colitermitum]|uniref:hypothetical protein n=1 Tax=Geminisphaera colitermitum TaxID=1148786 RepID=UPI0012FF4183|nr:hypothetical protein [Geminisphaera colitermitum]